MSREVNQWFWIQNGPQTSIQWVVGLCQSQRIWRQKQKHVMLFFSVVGAESVERLPGGEQANCQGKHSTFPSLISFCTYSDHILQISHWTVTVIRLVSFVVYFFQWELVEFCNHHKKVKETVKASHFHCGWKKKPQKTSVTLKQYLLGHHGGHGPPVGNRCAKDILYFCCIQCVQVESSFSYLDICSINIHSQTQVRSLNYVTSNKTLVAECMSHTCLFCRLFWRQIDRRFPWACCTLRTWRPWLVTWPRHWRGSSLTHLQGGSHTYTHQRVHTLNILFLEESSNQHLGKKQVRWSRLAKNNLTKRFFKLFFLLRLENDNNNENIQIVKIHTK